MGCVPRSVRKADRACSASGLGHRKASHPGAGHRATFAARRDHDLDRRWYGAGKASEAVPLAMRVLEMREKALPAGHPDKGCAVRHCEVSDTGLSWRQKNSNGSGERKARCAKSLSFW
jgi:hypothetical protein